jgi:hypothetical protein
VVAISHPLVREHGLYTSPIKLGIAPGRIDRTAPCLGEHNDRVFIHGLAGPEPEEYLALRADGGIR